jgi:LAGLIDADG endonuclease
MGRILYLKNRVDCRIIALRRNQELSKRKAIMTQDIPETTVAYIAGFFDGEGSVGLEHHKSGHIRLRVSISHNDRRPLDLIQKLYGGRIAIRHKRKAGVEYWQLNIYTAAAGRFFSAIAPYCIVKRESIAIAIAFVALIRLGRNRWQPLSQEEIDQREEVRHRLHALGRWAKYPQKVGVMKAVQLG